MSDSTIISRRDGSGSVAARRGRPPRLSTMTANADTRSRLIRAGLLAMTEQGFTATGLDSVLKQVGVPKGSFYYYFESKDAFTLEVIDSYAQFMSHRLSVSLEHPNANPAVAFGVFRDVAISGMARYGYSKGCLIASLSQSLSALSPECIERVRDVYLHWITRTADALREMQKRGDVSTHLDCDELATFFWMGWEGALLHAKLLKSPTPMTQFIGHFLNVLRAR
jgi:TetR/AcrR family transcriptional regulator, transcriptional repressor for nem operon